MLQCRTTLRNFILRNSGPGFWKRQFLKSEFARTGFRKKFQGRGHRTEKMYKIIPLIRNWGSPRSSTDPPCSSWQRIHSSCVDLFVALFSSLFVSLLLSVISLLSSFLNVPCFYVLIFAVCFLCYQCCYPCVAL